VAAAAERVLRPYNRWLAAMGRGETMAHCATTFTALVLRGRRAHVLHVGDSRAWLLRDGRLQQLTRTTATPTPTGATSCCARWGWKTRCGSITSNSRWPCMTA
jgi:hypothetical protein